MRNPCETSGLLSTDTQIRTDECKVVAVIPIANGTDQATISVHDAASSADASDANKIAELIVDAGLTAGPILEVDRGITCNNGIYLNLTGTGAKAIVLYSIG